MVLACLYDLRDPEDLALRQGSAQAMERFIEEPGLIEPMGRESRRLAEERFNVRKVNARLIEYMLG